MPGASSTPDETSTAEAALARTASAKLSDVSPPASIHGTVKDVKEKTVKVEVAPKVVIEMNRSAVLNVESKNKAKTGADSAEDKKG